VLKPTQLIRLTLLILPLSHSLQADEWARFRGPGGNGRLVHATTGLPHAWNNEANIAWKSPLPKGAGSPIVVGKQVMVTAFSGYAENLNNPGDKQNLRLHVLSYDVDSGDLLWDHLFAASDAEQEATPRIADHGYASSTPCSDGQAVYASFGPSGVVALDLQGKPLWRKSVGTGTAGFGAAASPIEFEDLVIVNASIESNQLVALDKKSGEVAWKVDGIDRAWTTPTLVTIDDGSTELVIHYKDFILGLDPRSGTRLWSCRGIPDYIVPCPVVEGQTVYFSGGRQSRTVAVRAGGRGDVTSTHRLWEVTHGANVTSPLVHEGKLYWSHDKGWAQCISAADGSEIYQQRFRSRDRVYASVVYGDSKFYMTLRNGTILVLEAKPEYRELAVNQLGEEGELFSATPAIYRDSLLIRSDKYLYRIRND
jgi:outer membrane protein assembly factor BamB